MPRQFFFEDETKQAGILGDFMVHKKYRVFGPALLLIQAAVNTFNEYGLDMVYTIPNKQSEIFAKMVGLNTVGIMRHFVKPLYTSRYVRRYVPCIIADVLSYVIDLGLRLVSKETYLPNSGSFDEPLHINQSYDVLWNTFKKSHTSMVGDRSAAYVEWKYFQNPDKTIRILSLKERYGNSVDGFVVFSIKDECLYILDILSAGTVGTCKLLKRIIDYGRKQHCYAIRVVCFGTGYLMPILKSFGFFTSAADTKVFSNGNKQLFDNCVFMAGDRNI
jgi:hypothetical protein